MNDASLPYSQPPSPLSLLSFLRRAAARPQRSAAHQARRVVPRPRHSTATAMSLLGAERPNLRPRRTGAPGQLLPPFLPRCRAPMSSWSSVTVTPSMPSCIASSLCLVPVPRHRPCAPCPSRARRNDSHASRASASASTQATTTAVPSHPRLRPRRATASSSHPTKPWSPSSTLAQMHVIPRPRRHRPRAQGSVPAASCLCLAIREPKPHDAAVFLRTAPPLTVSSSSTASSSTWRPRLLCPPCDVATVTPYSAFYLTLPR